MIEYGIIIKLLPSMLPGELPVFSVSYHFVFTENKHGITG